MTVITTSTSLGTGTYGTDEEAFYRNGSRIWAGSVGTNTSVQSFTTATAYNAGTVVFSAGSNYIATANVPNTNTLAPAANTADWTILPNTFSDGEDFAVNSDAVLQADDAEIVCRNIGVSLAPFTVATNVTGTYNLTNVDIHANLTANTDRNRTDNNWENVRFYNANTNYRVFGVFRGNTNHTWNLSNVQFLGQIGTSVSAAITDDVVGLNFFLARADESTSQLSNLSFWNSVPLTDTTRTTLGGIPQFQSTLNVGGTLSGPFVTEFNNTNLYGMYHRYVPPAAASRFSHLSLNTDWDFRSLGTATGYTRPWVNIHDGGAHVMYLNSLFGIGAPGTGGSFGITTIFNQGTSLGGRAHFMVGTNPVSGAGEEHWYAFNSADQFPTTPTNNGQAGTQASTNSGGMYFFPDGAWALNQNDTSNPWTGDADEGFTTASSATDTTNVVFAETAANPLNGFAFRNQQWISTNSPQNNNSVARELTALTPLSSYSYRKYSWLQEWPTATSSLFTVTPAPVNATDAQVADSRGTGFDTFDPATGWTSTTSTAYGADALLNQNTGTALVPVIPFATTVTTLAEIQTPTAGFGAAAGQHRGSHIAAAEKLGAVNSIATVTGTSTTFVPRPITVNGTTLNFDRDVVMNSSGALGAAVVTTASVTFNGHSSIVADDFVATIATGTNDVTWNRGVACSIALTGADFTLTGTGNDSDRDLDFTNYTLTPATYTGFTIRGGAVGGITVSTVFNNLETVGATALNYTNTGTNSVDFASLITGTHTADAAVTLTATAGTLTVNFPVGTTVTNNSTTVNGVTYAGGTNVTLAAVQVQTQATALDLTIPATVPNGARVELVTGSASVYNTSTTVSTTDLTPTNKLLNGDGTTVTPGEGRVLTATNRTFELSYPSTTTFPLTFLVKISHTNLNPYFQAFSVEENTRLNTADALTYNVTLAGFEDQSTNIAPAGTNISDGTTDGGSNTNTTRTATRSATAGLATHTDIDGDDTINALAIEVNGCHDYRVGDELVANRAQGQQTNRMFALDRLNYNRLQVAEIAGRRHGDFTGAAVTTVSEASPAGTAQVPVNTDIGIPLFEERWIMHMANDVVLVDDAGTTAVREFGQQRVANLFVAAAADYTISSDVNIALAVASDYDGNGCRDVNCEDATTATGAAQTIIMANVESVSDAQATLLTSIESVSDEVETVGTAVAAVSTDIATDLDTRGLKVSTDATSIDARIGNPADATAVPPTEDSGLYDVESSGGGVATEVSLNETGRRQVLNAARRA